MTTPVFAERPVTATVTMLAPGKAGDKLYDVFVRVPGTTGWNFLHTALSADEAFRAMAWLRLERPLTMVKVLSKPRTCHTG